MWVFKEAVLDWLLPLSLAATIYGVSSFISHLLEDKKDEVIDEDIRTRPIYSANSISVEIRVPRLSVGNIVGRNGRKINEIQVISNTRIFFRDAKRTDDLNICVIRGLPENVEIAERCVYDIILWYPDSNTVEIFIPIRTYCRIVSRYGDKLRGVCRICSCKVITDNWCFHNDFSTRRVFLQGSDEEIEQAKSFLAEKLEEEQPPVTRSGSLPMLARRGNQFPDAYNEGLIIDVDEVFNTGNNGVLEVFVAAVENPEKFWIHIMGPDIVALAKLIEDMTNYYEKHLNRCKHALKEVTVGQLIAVPFQNDDNWYRAKVLRIFPNKTLDRNTSLEVFYVDHGHLGYYKKREVFELKEEFLTLKHQAIRCILANVMPRNDTWCEKSIEFFRKLTIMGVWQTLSAKIVDYKNMPGGEDEEDLQLPCVRLVDTSRPAYVDIASELVRLDYASWLDDNQARDAIP